MTDWQDDDEAPPADSLDIAIIGMVGRVPGAPNLDKFWENLRDGVESIQFFTPEDMVARGLDPSGFRNPLWVPAMSRIKDIEWFDAGFFGFAPREAEQMDPQHRLFLEGAWEALENAGYDAERFPGLVGVYGGISHNMYLLFNLLRSDADLSNVLQLTMGNDKDFVSTRASYKLDLKGPSVNVQTGCSTSLVVVHMACQALLAYQCDMALAGTVCLQLPDQMGYTFQEGGVLSSDGHCRPFSARADGAIAGSGVTFVVLKRLSEALADGDTIHAVIKGTAINNDGASKIGYTAPSIEGQARVIDMAQAAAAVEPRSITYVEAHGSATPLGDPIEVAALTRAFRARTEDRRFCALGTVKSNIGHLDTSAGMAGLLKTVLALKNKQIPPSLHFEEPNPEIDFASSPFFVPTKLMDWPEGDTPRRAGVSSFGIGGTNAHVIVEEAPEPAPSPPSRPVELLLLSARSQAAVERATDNLAEHLEAKPDLELSDVAWTLQAGRKRFWYRRAVIVDGTGGTAEAAAALRARDPRRVLEGMDEATDRAVVFLFPGLGDHYPGMAAGLYRDEPVFRREVDRCAELLRPALGLDLRQVLFPAGAETGEDLGPDLRRMLGRADAETVDEAARNLARTAVAQPAVFVVEYALARLWQSWGVHPAALLGYSLGEYVAACIAGVFGLEDALRLVAERARLLDALPPGAMLAVPLAEEEVRPLLADRRLSVSAVNGPGFTVVGGPLEEVADLERQLAGRGVTTRSLQTTHAFHTWMMEPAAGRLAELVGRVKRNAPEIPILSNVTGAWMTPGEAADPAYWAAHLCEPVRFGAGLAELWRDPARALLEVGPGQSLGSLALQHPAAPAPGAAVVVPSLRNVWDRQGDSAFAQGALARLWIAGGRIDWAGVHGGVTRRRIGLPNYPWERQRYWVEAVRGAFLPERTVASREVPAPAEAGTPATVAAGVGGAAPISPSGMVRRSLHARPSLRTPYVAPSSELERTVGGLWERLLGIDGLGVHDNFFELGGHSLLGTQLVNLVRDVFAIEMPLRVLFESPNIAGMAAAVAAVRSAAAADGGAPAVAPGVVPVPRDGNLPLSFAQSRMWFLNQFDPLSPVYNIPFAVRLEGAVDPAAFDRAVTEIVRRHESLRTAFPAVEGKPVQAIAPPPERFPVPRIDLAALDSTNQDEEVRRLGLMNARTGFDLGRGPVLRVTLVRLGETDNVVLINMHHIVSDGWSVGVFLGELGTLYEDFRQGRPSSLPEPVVQYADFAAWQSRWLQGEVLEQHLDYWRRRLAGSPPALDLPLDRPRGDRPGAFSGRRMLVISGETYAGFRALAERAGVTPYILTLAALDAALGRHSNQDDIPVGTAIANRTRAEVAGLIGFFVNTLVLRTDLSGDPTFGELLGRVREVALGAFANQDLPFEKLVEELQPERDLTLTPFFQVMFTFQNTPAPDIELPGLALRPVDSATNAAMFDLTLTAVEGGPGVFLALEYRRDLFDGSTAERLLDHLGNLLAAGVAHPDERLSRLPMLSEYERFQLLAEWNDTAARGPLAGRPFHCRIAELAARQPEALAVASRAVRLTYGELDAHADRLARRLRQAGVRAETPVAVLLERSPEMVVALLAAWKAGGSYLPLDPAYPADRLAFLVSDAGAPVVVTRTGLRALLPEGAPVIDLEAERESLAAFEAGPLPETAPFDPQRLAYVIYTSGSTGVPKGVEVPHGGLLNLLDWHQAAFGLTAADRATLLAGPAFDASVLEIWPALAAGASLHIPDDEVRLSPLRLAHWVAEEEITFSFLPTPLAEGLLREPSAAGVEGVALKTVITGGDRLHRSPAPGLPFRLHNLYGPTENSVVTTAAFVEPGSAGAPPIGRPVANHRVLLLDRAGEPVPLGVAGELCAGGPGLARGYRGRPDLTAAAFVPDPLVPGERVYRTGDLARRRADGELEFLGRTDQQVKIRGYRIEIGEIEAAIASYPGLRDCAVVLHSDANGEPRLVAYVVPTFSPAPAAVEMRRFFRLHLPEPMVPAAFVTLASLPLTPNGKLDRDALPAPALDEPEKPFVAPSTPVEEELARIWGEVLNRSQVSVQDNFFDLGGHSLLAAQCVSRIRESLGVELPLQSLFETATLADLADLVVRTELEQVDEDSLREMLDNMDEDELRALLEGEQELELEGGGGGGETR